MRQRVTQLEALLRSFVEPGGVERSSTDHSETPSTQAAADDRKPVKLSNSIELLPGDINMSEGGAALDASSPAPGQLTLDDTETSYVGSAHWAAVLNEVCLNRTIPQEIPY